MDRTEPDNSELFDTLSKRNASFLGQFSHSDLTAPALEQVAFLTCMDSRVEPLRIFSYELGDVKVIRNAGARVTEDVLRSLILATNFLDVTSIVVMQHVDCALAFKSNDLVVSGLKVPVSPADETRDFLAMPDPDQALREDIALILECPLIPTEVVVLGIRYDVKTGGIVRVL